MKTKNNKINLNFDKIQNEIDVLQEQEQNIGLLLNKLSDLMSNNINEDNKDLVEKYLEENSIPNEIKINVYYSFQNNGKILFDTDEMNDEFKYKMEEIISKYKNFKEKTK